MPILVKVLESRNRRASRGGSLPSDQPGSGISSLDSYYPGTEPSRSLRLHLTLVLSGPRSEVVQPSALPRYAPTRCC